MKTWDGPKLPIMEPKIRDKDQEIPLTTGCIVYELKGGVVLLVPEQVKVGLINPNREPAVQVNPETARDFAKRMRDLADVVEQADRELTSLIVVPPPGLKV